MEEIENPKEVGPNRKSLGEAQLPARVIEGDSPPLDTPPSIWILFGPDHSIVNIVQKIVICNSN